MPDNSDFRIDKEDGFLSYYTGPGGHVDIPFGVTTIGESAFEYCHSLTSVTVPETVTCIEEGAFRNCLNLTSVIISEGVTSIEDEAFYGCDRLKSVTVPESLTSIGRRAFSIGKDTVIIISDPSRVPPAHRPNAVIGFVETGHGSSDPHFAAYSKYIKANAAKLVDTAMAHPALLSLMCSEKLIAPKYAELYADAAQKSGNAELIAMMLDYCNNKISAEEKEKAEKQKEKEQDTVVDRMAARVGHDGIEGLNIVVTGKLETFENREAIKKYIVEKGGNLLSSLSPKTDYLIMNDPRSDSAKAQKAKELGVEVITERRFNEITGRLFLIEGTVLKKYYGTGGEIIIPSTVTSIEERAFSRCTALTSVIISEGVSNIGIGAFEYCTGLTNVTVPNSVNNIGYHAFMGCKGLADKDGFVIQHNNLLYYSGPGGDVFIPNTVKKIVGAVFYGCYNLKNVFIPEGVTSIGNEVFIFCSNLTSVFIPDTVKSIGNHAFRNCTSLKNITIPDSLTSIGDRAFEGCRSLTGMTIPDSVKNIGKLVFSGCDSLTSVTIPNSVKSIADRAFYGCKNLTSVTIPEGVTSIGDQVFGDQLYYDCPNLVLKVSPGSYAEKYAKDNNLSFSTD